jgi:MinD superfamily P-loop ATPase
MRELVVISGKGGTGKTSVVASLAALARPCVLADCDVDAADLHLVVNPNVLRRESFTAGARARLDVSRCTACGKCREVCRFGAVARVEPIEELACEGCGVCAWVCPAHAIKLVPVEAGEWYVSETRHGPMVHARLGVAGENSGKLVSLVRQQARETARASGLECVLIDGSPGVGCPVIASLTGATLALVVTEPTVSGLHDLERVCELTRHFRLTTVMCINKWDLHEEMTQKIEAFANGQLLPVVGRIRYDRSVTEAQVKGLSVVEYARDGVATDIRIVWDAVLRFLQAPCTAVGAAIPCSTCVPPSGRAQPERKSL